MSNTLFNILLIGDKEVSFVLKTFSLKNQFEELVKVFHKNKFTLKPTSMRTKCLFSDLTELKVYTSIANFNADFDV